MHISDDENTTQTFFNIIPPIKENKMRSCRKIRRLQLAYNSALGVVQQDAARLVASATLDMSSVQSGRQPTAGP